MRVVLDLNVLISASIAPRGIPAALMDAWAEERFELIVSPEVLAELEDVLSRKRLRRRLTPEEADAFVARVRLGSRLVDDPPPEHSTPVSGLLAIVNAGQSELGNRWLRGCPGA